MKRIAAAGLASLAVLGVVVVAERESSSVRPPAGAPRWSQGKTIVSLPDDRAARDPALVVEGPSVRGDGVTMKEPGALAFTSSTGVVVAQVVTDAHVVAHDGTRQPLPRQSTKATTTTAGGRSSARYDGFFRGLDLEYRWDGRDVEELFHVDDALKHSVSRDAGALVVTNTFPGLTPKDTLLRPAEGVHLARDAGVAGATAAIVGTGDVELMTGGGRFVLASAVAVDVAGHRLALERRFAFDAAGLSVSVRVPGEWLATATGDVVIDPSIIDAKRFIELSGSTNATGSSLVVDKTGRMHSLYAAVYDSLWSVVYSSSADNGITWSKPAIVYQDAEFPDVQPPSLVVDSTSSLHALWTATGAEGATLRYAACFDGCTVPKWEFVGTSGPNLKPLAVDPSNLDGSAFPLARLAIDQNDTTHIVWLQVDDLHYATIDAQQNVKFNLNTPTNFRVISFDPNQRTPEHRFRRSALVITADNRPALLALTLDHGFIASVFDGSAWTDALQLDVAGLSDQAGACQGIPAVADVAAAVAPDGTIHVAYTVESDSCATLYPGLLTLAPTLDRAELRFVGGVDRRADGPVLIQPPLVSVTSDNLVQLFWVARDGSGQARLLAAQGGTVGPLQDPTVVLEGSVMSAPKILISQAFPNSMRNIDPSHFGGIVVFGGQELRFIGPDGAVDIIAPIPIFPGNHGYVDTTNPLFQWKPPADPSFTTLLEIDESPLFDSDRKFLSNELTAFDQIVGTDSFPFVVGGCYYWRLSHVRDGQRGPPTAPLEFCIAEETLPAARLRSPIDGSDPRTVTPTYQWQFP